MLGTLVIVFRECIEAGLIVGIVLAATRGIPGRGRHVAFGVAAGVLGACIVAAFAGQLADAFDGAGQELLNAAILALAVVMLTWHVVWMARHGREMARDIKQVGTAVATGERPLSALTLVVGLAVLREGFEVVLFLSGIAVGGAGGGSMLAGSVAGLVLAAALSALTYAGLVRLPVGALFSVTGWLVTFLACGLASQAAGQLQQAGWIEAMARTMWDTSSVLSVASVPGLILRTLVGYTDRPTELQILVYAATLAVIALLATREKQAGARRVVRS